MNVHKICFICVMASFGIIGWCYGWPIYRDAISVLNVLPFLLVNSIAVVFIVSGSWFIYTILGVIGDEIKCVSIDQEI